MSAAQRHARAFMPLRYGLDAREVEPEMPEIIVLAKDDLAIAARHCVAEYIAVTAALQNGDGHAEIAYHSFRRVVAEHFGHLGTTETEHTPVMGHGHRANRCQERAPQGPAEPALFIQRKKCAIGVRGIEQAAVAILCPSERVLSPGAFRQRNRLALEPAGGNVIPPNVRGAVLA